MAQLPQPSEPDLAELSECFNGAARQISRLQNIPAFNEGRIIINQLQEIAQSIRDLGTRLDASETNGIARLHNSTVTTVDTPFYPLRDRQNRHVDRLPENGRALMQLSAADLNTLLQALDHPIDGTVVMRRKRFRQFIGIMTEI